MKTVFNKILVDTTKQPIFLGESLSLQRYDKFKYDVFFDLFKSQLELFWRPEEINLSKDKNDFKTLSDNEKNIFTLNLKFQTLLDSVIQRTIPKLTDLVSLPEVESCFNIWSFFENIHSYAYTYIIKNVYPEPGKVFDEILMDKEILARAESVSKQYDELINYNGDLKSLIYLSLIATNILEGLRFYVSFACSFAFGENKLMIGNADIIKLINRDENKHLQITQKLIKILSTVDEEGFIETVSKNKDIAVDMFKHAVNEEKAWANYVFSQGSILGLNEKILSQYIEWLANARMRAIGLPQLFDGVKNPIEGWIKAWGVASSGMVQVAPQESEITSYLIGSMKVDDLDLSSFKL